MNPNNKTDGLSIEAVIAAFVSTLINIVLFPVTFFGYIIWVGKLILTGRSSGVSTSAQGPLSARWTQHNMGIRKDEASNRLLPVLFIVVFALSRIPGLLPANFSAAYAYSPMTSIYESAVGVFGDTLPSANAGLSPTPINCNPRRRIGSFLIFGQARILRTTARLPN